jgi:hypothetical protein
MEGSEKQEWLQSMQAANLAIESLYSGPECPRVVMALVSKYVAWTQYELEEWQVGIFPQY